MLNKLAFRNAKRSMRDYAVYLITMTAVAAMMFAFNSLIFSEDIRNMCSEAMVLGIMLGFVTFFIVLIVAWLINYMAGFMLRIFHSPLSMRSSVAIFWSSRSTKMT